MDCFPILSQRCWREKVCERKSQKVLLLPLLSFFQWMGADKGWTEQKRVITVFFFVSHFGPLSPPHLILSLPQGKFQIELSKSPFTCCILQVFYVAERNLQSVITWYSNWFIYLTLSSRRRWWKYFRWECITEPCIQPEPWILNRCVVFSQQLFILFTFLVGMGIFS